MRDSRRTRLVLALLALTAFTLITLDYRHSSLLTRLRHVAADVFGPVERVVASGVRPVGRWFGAIGHASTYQREVGRLQREEAALRSQVRTYADVQRQLADLQRLDRLAAAAHYRVVAAHVVALGNALGFDWTATLDVGLIDGVHKGMTVLDGDGLVGRVEDVSSTTSTVLLAVDGQSYVGARLEGSGEIGYVQGNGLRPLTFTLLNAQASLRPGQRLVTFGSANQVPYQPGVPIGTITSVLPTPGGLTKTALVRPFVTFTSLDTVAVVVTAPRTDPRDSLLPLVTQFPGPSPSPSPSPFRSRSPAASGSPSPGSTGASPSPHASG